MKGFTFDYNSNYYNVNNGKKSIIQTRFKFDENERNRFIFLKTLMHEM